ncbi:TetR family transcriptional regulator [Streptomyces sp. TRM 70351]|uniref:TetR/AcrR family transcriptional regulator n=1 Tax=Streptomyces sp. TRM 70351 TaxID=3116552 RepID=UPI002E7B648C|nr:TetR family transcriptional regulator [Streptomyces sp. TRM 70351]MEE1930584.1 TetR family transcriptional regulator [Streptomyces sp. TRM 70351]
MPRRHDPQRRQRIVDAAIRVVGTQGLAGLSHRAVAAEADVPLGSTTYHFATLDDLLVAALRQAGDAWLAEADAWERALPRDAALDEAVLRLMTTWLCGDRPKLLLEYELYLAALRHERLRPLASHCLDGLTAVLRRRTPDDATARALAGYLDGALLQCLLTGRALDAAATRAALARVAGLAVPAAPSGPSRPAAPSGRESER